MEAASRAFEDWEFRFLEQESSIDMEDESVEEQETEGKKEGQVEKELVGQQHAVSTAQVREHSPLPSRSTVFLAR